MNLRQIEIFRAIMTTGSISDASRLLHVSAPAVSRLLSHTENQLGFPLFERIRGRLHPTSEARSLMHEIELVHRGVQRVNKLSLELGKRRQSVLNIVASPSIGQMLVPEAIGCFLRGHPAVRINFHCLSYQYLKERLLERHADLGISILPVDHPNLLTTPVARSRIVCICPQGAQLARQARVSLADLRPFPLISYPPDTPFGMRVEQMFAAEGETLKVAIEVGSPQNACDLVQTGSGVALVDEFSLQGRPGTRCAVVPVANAPEVVADLVYLRAEPLLPTAEAFIVALRSVLTRHGFGSAADRPDISRAT